LSALHRCEIRDAAIKPSLAKIASLLQLLDQRPISNAVDATNYVLLGRAQTHARVRSDRADRPPPDHSQSPRRRNLKTSTA